MIIQATETLNVTPAELADTLLKSTPEEFIAFWQRIHDQTSEDRRFMLDRDKKIQYAPERLRSYAKALGECGAGALTVALGFGQHVTASMVNKQLEREKQP